MKKLFSSLRDESFTELKQEFEPKIEPSAQAQSLDISPAILDFEVLRDMKLPERKLILPWLPEGGLTMVSAERGIGKTHFALSLAYAITSGTSFMRWSIQQTTDVLYIDGEMALIDIRDRLKSLIQSPLKAKLRVLSHEWFYQSFEEDLTVSDSKIQEGILKQLKDEPATRLIILDNLSSLSRIREDKSDDWRQYMLPLLIKCRRMGVAVVLIHHCGKSGDQRGTGAREDHLDTSIRLSKVISMTDTANMGSCFQVSFTKSRHCYDDSISPFIATLQTLNGISSWQVETIEVSTKDKLIKLVKEAGESGIKAIDAAAQLKVSPTLISKLKKICETEGIFEHSSGKSPLKLSNNKNF